MSDHDEVLFEIRRSHLNKGLRGFPVGTVRTSKVDPHSGVSYVGYPIAALAQKDPEAVIYLLLNDGHPMEWLMNGLLFLGMTGKTGDYREDGLNLIARSGALVANVFRIRNGWGAPREPQPELGLVENMVYMMGIPDADTAKVTRMLRIFYVLHMDHGGGNLSTFSGNLREGWSNSS